MGKYVEHSSLGITGSRGNSLKGKFIVFGVTGSVGAVRSFDLVRELMRRGAKVQVVMSEAAQGIIHKNVMHYASGREVITKLSGEVEHVNLMGGQGVADLFLVAPATANTIGKIAHGIDDTPVTTFATTALGAGRKVVVVPAMHGSMYNHKAVVDNLERLAKIGVRVVFPRVEEGKAKVAEIGEVVLEVERALGNSALNGKKVVISAGATEVDVDPVRVLSNKASGKTGLEIAREAYRQGAQVSLIHNCKSYFPPEHSLNPIKVRTPQEMQGALLKELQGADVFVSTAAVSDFSVDFCGEKITSGKECEIALKKSPKLIKEVHGKFPGVFVVGFKAETNKEDRELVQIVKEKIGSEEWGIGVGNDVAKGGIGSEENRVVIVDSQGERWVEGSKEKIARELVSSIRGFSSN